MDIKELEEKISTNAEKIENNAQQIEHNTGAIEVLHTINNCKRRYFTMWLITFITLVVTFALLASSLCYIIYLLCR